MIKVGIYGATGYMGGEALRVLLEHPQVRLAWITSRQETELSDHHPNLFDSPLRFIRPEAITPCDVVFMAVPSGVSMEMAPKLIKQGMKVIDLGSDFRLENRAVWEKVYKRKHTSWAQAQKAVYGITELRRDEIRGTSLVANPGCFASAAILGLAPLVENNLVDLGNITVDGLSGTAGVGAELSRPAHHAEIGNNLIPYNVVNHRHTYEVEQELSRLSGKKVSVHFTPIYVPIIRGVLDICHAFPKRKITREQLLDLYRDYYQGEFFVKVYDLPKEKGVSWQYKPYPWVNTVSGTNYNLIGMDVDEERGRIVIFSALDSIGKGGSHAGVQNMNLMFGLDETTGLTRHGLHPI
ncbi:MAG TPA: N-acetyl-gamma-glutamyl-phosphate reductase [bacterium]|nr:N-acetyl-gamma-glutamyl-phosphate reductase [bacterium]